MVGGELVRQRAGALVLAVDLDQEHRQVGAGVAEHQVGEDAAAAGQAVLDLGGERSQVSDAGLGEQAGGGGIISSPSACQ